MGPQGILLRRRPASMSSKTPTWWTLPHKCLADLDRPPISIASKADTSMVRILVLDLPIISIRTGRFKTHTPTDPVLIFRHNIISSHRRSSIICLILSCISSHGCSSIHLILKRTRGFRTHPPTDPVLDFLPPVTISNRRSSIICLLLKRTGGFRTHTLRSAPRDLRTTGQTVGTPTCNISTRTRGSHMPGLRIRVVLDFRHPRFRRPITRKRTAGFRTPAVHTPVLDLREPRRSITTSRRVCRLLGTSIGAKCLRAPRQTMDTRTRCTMRSPFQWTFLNWISQRFVKVCMSEQMLMGPSYRAIINRVKGATLFVLKVKFFQM